MYVYVCCSYECGQHETKARERKEALEDQAKDLQASLSRFEGRFVWRGN